MKEKMKIEDGIMVLHNIVDKKFCQMVVNYSNKVCKGKLPTFGGSKDYRRVNGHILKDTNIGDKIYFQLINNQIKNFYSHYKYRFPRLRSNVLSQIDILKYNVGGKYDYHIDTSDATYRNISIIINLNENYEGGDLIFSDQFFNETKRISLKTGSVVIFPSNFFYPHKIEPIIKGKRYSIAAWLV